MSIGQRAAETAMHDDAAHELTVKLVKARNAASAYFRLQDSEARKLGHKGMCEFAHLIARGTVPAPPYVDLGELEIVSKWFQSRTEVNQWALRFQFDKIHGGVPWKRMLAKYRQGWNRNKYAKRIEYLLRDLGGQL